MVFILGTNYDKVKKMTCPYRRCTWDTTALAEYQSVSAEVQATVKGKKDTQARWRGYFRRFRDIELLYWQTNW